MFDTNLQVFSLVAPCVKKGITPVLVPEEYFKLLQVYKIMYPTYLSHVC